MSDVAPLTLADFRAAAVTRMDPGTEAFFEGGAGDEVTLRANESAYAAYRLRPFAGLVGDVDLRITMLGREVSMPVGVAPTARQGLLDPAGEVATVRAAQGERVAVCVSSAASRSLEDVAAAAEPGWWFQSYPGIGPSPERARDLGCGAVVLTVDTAAPGHRDREMRAARAEPDHPAYVGGSGYARGAVDLGARSPRAVSWADVARVVEQSALPVVAKGVLTGEDARAAVESGVSAVWVSNHGGRQLDRAPATLEVLAEVVEAVGGAAEVYLDGGVRRGADVAVALALGARAVFVGRPVLWGLCVDGEQGVREVLAQLRRESGNVLALLGVTTPSGVTTQHLMSPGCCPRHSSLVSSSTKRPFESEGSE